MTRLLLLRHGESTWNAQGRWQGWADPPLSPRGERQAGHVAGALAAAGLSAAASSDLQRARRTAEILAAALALPSVGVYPGLRERNVGHWSGLTFPEIEVAWPGVLADYRSGRYARPPGGEDSETLVARSTRALAALAADHPGRTLLVVTHGGVIRSLERSVGLEPRPGGLPNLGGRWFNWCEGALVSDEPFMPPMPDPDMATAPPSR